MTPLITSSSNMCGAILSLCALSIATVKNAASLMSNFNEGHVRPRIPISVNGVEDNWLYDTGAARTCMNTKMFHKLFPNGE